MAMRNSLGKSSFTHRKTHAPFSERACGYGTSAIWIHTKNLPWRSQRYILYFLSGWYIIQEIENYADRLERFGNTSRFTVTMSYVKIWTRSLWRNEARPLITTKKIYLNSRPKPMFCNQDLGFLLVRF
ncbi:hypothetical protein TWF751_002656 [Orbilia oligospora]|nr:hypothetical protein TWF751_002656 [Orbilia oligospora]